MRKPPLDKGPNSNRKRSKVSATDQRKHEKGGKAPSTETAYRSRTDRPRPGEHLSPYEVERRLWCELVDEAFEVADIINYIANVFPWCLKNMERTLERLGVLESPSKRAVKSGTAARQSE